MTENAQPQDIAAELVTMINNMPGNGVIADTAPTPNADASSADEQDVFATRPGDPPDFAERMLQARRTVTEKTTAIAREREKLQEQLRQADSDRRDAELFRALKQAPDPSKAAEALMGKTSSGNGFNPEAVLRAAKDRFDEPTYQGIADIAKAIWMQQAAENLTPYQQAIQTLIGDRSNSEWKQVQSEYGEDAARWKDQAVKIQQTTGLNLSDALLVASQGQVALSKVKAQVLDARKRAATPASVPEQSVSQPKIALTREQRTEMIRRAAAAAGNEQFMR